MRESRYTIPWAAALLLLGSVSAVQAQDPNACDEPGDEPDVIVGDLPSVLSYGELGGFNAFAVGTTSCNVGTCWLDWIFNTANHPVIGQNLYRLRDGRFEQIGQSWLKHGFFALSGSLCDPGCLPTDGDHLGVNCSDPYSAGLNGAQDGLGPKFEVNPTTGEFEFPFFATGQTGDTLYKRLRVANDDLDPGLNQLSKYFVEGHYIAADDAAAGNDDNNASYREVLVGGSGPDYTLTVSGATVREQPGIFAWKANDAGVTPKTVDVPGDGRYIFASKATDLGGGLWGYEYALHNLNSHRGARAFRVPVPSTAQPTNVGFHDVEYHSGEPYDGTDWAVSSAGGVLEWQTSTFAQNPNANALRWGTLYNFRFVMAAGPRAGSAEIELFRPGAPTTFAVGALVPIACDGNGVCEGAESCATCAVDCLDQAGGGGCCGDDVCDPGEQACTCSADCGPCLIPCGTDPECDDGVYCNGLEVCSGGFCDNPGDPCPGQVCDELGERCIECFSNGDCSNGLFCDGVEQCFDGNCMPGADPCPGELCDDTTDACTGCDGSGPCQDGLFCNGVETCSGTDCMPGVPPCPAQCDEIDDQCFDCLSSADCADGLFCNGFEFCDSGTCSPGVEPCPAFLCDEFQDACLGNVSPQPRYGDPLPGLDEDELARFEAGRQLFAAALDAGSGLGPVYNGNRCSACHGQAGPTPGDAITHFGVWDEVGGTFDPLTALGGSLLQASSVSPACAESVPPEAGHVVSRVPIDGYGLGLVESIDAVEIEARALVPPAGITGRVHWSPVAELAGTPGLGRFGWKAQHPTVLTASAAESRDQLGLTHRFDDTEHAPNGDPVLLAQCDASDPEDVVDTEGLSFIDRVSDYLRFLAPPPQTPRSGMTGETVFNLARCTDCHTIGFTTPDVAALDPVFRNQGVRAYSDFLLHDMGQGADHVEQGDAAPNEMRTTPLWGLRARAALWHDGSISGGTFEDRVLAAIDAHDLPGSEAQASVQALDSLPSSARDVLVRFLGSLGQLEFDMDRDGDVDPDDFVEFEACRGSGISAEDDCAIADVDQDGDVDDDDFWVFAVVAEGDAGSIPDGGAIPGEPLRLSRNLSTGIVTLAWGASCVTDGDDYAVYEGTLGMPESHQSRSCSTGGATTYDLSGGPVDATYLVVPTNGYHEGGYGLRGDGTPRPAAQQSCLPQSIGTCDP